MVKALNKMGGYATDQLIKGLVMETKPYGNLGQFSRQRGWQVQNPGAIKLHVSEEVKESQCAILRRCCILGSLASMGLTCLTPSLLNQLYDLSVLLQRCFSFPICVVKMAPNPKKVVTGIK